MKVHSFVLTLTLVFSFGVPGCSRTKSNPSITLCKEAMALNANQLSVGDQERWKLIEGCVGGGYGRTPEQWQCVITLMNEGQPYLKATDTCFPKETGQQPL